MFRKTESTARHAKARCSLAEHEFMSTHGIAFVIGLGTVIGFYIQFPTARPEGVLVVALIHAGFAWLALTVGRMALDFFGLRPGRR